MLYTRFFPTCDTMTTTTTTPTPTTPTTTPTTLDSLSFTDTLNPAYQHQPPTISTSASGSDVLLHVITQLPHALTRLIADDPIRPEIPLELRVGDLESIFVETSLQGEPLAVLCVAYRDSVPSSVSELLDHTNNNSNSSQQILPSVVVFYTIWSYSSGAGRDLIGHARAWIQTHRPYITTFVTLSPQTALARRFHLRNGALELRANADTINYLYP